MFHTTLMRVKDKERTHRSRPETHSANSSWRPGEHKDGDTEIEVAFAGLDDRTSGLFAARTLSGENTGSGTKLRMAAASTSNVRG